MRVVHLINSLDTGGAESFVAELVPALAARGLDADLAVLQPANGTAAGLLRAHGFAVARPVGANHRFDPRAIARIRRRTREADVVHAHLFPTQHWTAAAWFGRSARPLLVTTEHNTANRRRAHALTRAVDRAMYRHYDAVVSVSSAVAAAVRPLLDVDHTRHECVPTAIDRARFRPGGRVPPPAHATDARHAIGGRSTILMVASFSPQKDQETLIRAMTHLPRAVNLVLAGTGPRLGAARALAYALDLGHRVKFVGHSDDVPGLLAEAWVAVLASHHEGMPLVALEAFAAGVPFVGSAVPGLADLAARGGVSVAPGDPVALATAIGRLLPGSAERTDCIRRGYRVADEHAIERIAERHHALYAALSDASARAAASSSSPA